jgi:dCMP deaminase
MSNIQKWDLRFLEMAKLVSRWSKDPSTKVGSVITDKNHKVISIGYNGLPSKVPDYNSILENREEKYKFIIHAETNAILTAKTSVENCIVYTYPFLPCTNCASMLIQSGISRVVSFECLENRWKDRIKASKNMFEIAGVEIIEYGVYI